MRIAVGQQWQETNTFNPIPTTRRDFEEFGVLRGQEVVERMANSNELGGFIQSLRQWPEKPEIVGLARLPAWPSGIATADTFTWMRGVLVEELRRAMPVDAVLLALHGAMVADGVPDVEGEILKAVRAIVGPKMPLVATLDLHTNLTRLMVEHAGALVLYHTTPHVDIFETGERGAAVLRRIIVDGVRPVTAYQRLPMVVPADRANTQDPTSISYHLRERLQAMEKDPRILAAGLATVQPWLDIPDLGGAVVIVSDGDPALAKTFCAEIANELWAKRSEYLGPLVPTEEAVRRAHAISDGLVVLSDCADATTAGSPGDGTWLLRELLKYEWPRPALITIVSPEVVAEAQRLGVGAELNTPLGGVRDSRFSKPVTVKAKVANLFDAKFMMSGHLSKNMDIDMGPSAVLHAGTVHIVVTARTGPHFAPELFRAAGIDPFAASVLIAKSPCGFRAAYASRAKEIMVVNAPGCAPADFWKYEYKAIPRPLWPWDEIANWNANPSVSGM